MKSYLPPNRKPSALISGCFLFCQVVMAQVATGYTSVGIDGGGTTHAECTEIIAFDNYNDNMAGNVGGQNFAIALLNGDTLYLNITRSGNSTYTLQPPATMGSCFGSFGYLNLVGNSDFYEYNYGDMAVTFSNIVLKDAAGNIVPDYTMMAFDGEGTGNGEFITFTAPSGRNWYDWDSMSAPNQLCTPARSGEGTNIAQITGDCNNTYYTSFGFAVDSPGSIVATIHGGGSGKEAIVLGIKRIIVAPNDTVCTTGAVNININPVNASTGTTYTWTAPVVSPLGNITGATAQGAPVTTIAQTLTNTTNAAATVTYTMSPVSCGLPGNSFTATVVLLPGSSTNSMQNICGSTATIVASGSGSWSAGGSNPVVANIANPNSSTTTVGGMSLSGNYLFIWTNSRGCTDSVTLAVGNTGTAPQLSANHTTICPGDSATICAPTGFTSYFWNTGDTTICITTPYAGNYYVTVTESGGCSALSGNLGITVRPPSPVTISVSGDTLFVYSAVSYQWYINGNAIAGANTQTYIAVTPGDYTVEVSDTNGCSATSSVVLVTGIAPVENDLLALYPNPSIAGWQLDVSDRLIGAGVQIFDAAGRLVFESQIRSSHAEIDPDIARGVYWMRISSAGITVTAKLVKL